MSFPRGGASGSWAGLVLDTALGAGCGDGCAVASQRDDSRPCPLDTVASARRYTAQLGAGLLGAARPMSRSIVQRSRMRVADRVIPPPCCRRAPHSPVGLAPSAGGLAMRTRGSRAAGARRTTVTRARRVVGTATVETRGECTAQRSWASMALGSRMWCMCTTETPATYNGRQAHNAKRRGPTCGARRLRGTTPHPHTVAARHHAPHASGAAAWPPRHHGEGLSVAGVVTVRRLSRTRGCLITDCCGTSCDVCDSLAWGSRTLGFS